MSYVVKEWACLKGKNPHQNTTQTPHHTESAVVYEKGSFDGLAFKCWVHGPGAVGAVTSYWEAQRHTQNQWHPAFIKEEFDPLLFLLVIQDDNGRQAALAQCAGEKVGFNVLPGTVGSKDWLVISPRRKQLNASSVKDKSRTKGEGARQIWFVSVSAHF